METIKVNMTPCDDVQNIHASQNDGEAREWEFELHNNGELIDTSEITEQLFFKAYKGGTEQILPENTSTPITSPFLGDIRYPQGLLTDQEFTYRQSPTEEDGLAKITDIKGNTLNWNQQLRALSSTYWAVTSQTSGSFADGVGTFTSTGTTFGCYVRTDYRFAKAGHKYLFSVEVTSSQSGNVNFGMQNVPSQQNVTANTKTRLQSIVEATTDNANVICYKTQATEGDTFVVSNFFAIDLTKMGLDIIDPSEFTSLYPLPYYPYNSGSLIPFNGNGLKTVGKNLIKLSADKIFSQQRVAVEYTDSGAVFTANDTYARIGFTFDTRVGETYTISFKGSSNGDYKSVYLSNEAGWSYNYRAFTLSTTERVERVTFTATSDVLMVGFYITATGSTGTMTISDLQLEFGSTVTSYEPYTESVINLPISTYFPTGMKQAGNVYDELIPTKATTRMRGVDLGTLTFNQSSNFYYRQNSQDLGIKADAMVSFIAEDSNITSVYYHSNSGQFRVYVNDISIAPNGMLYYELATPIETPITTASLVTENAEIPLSNEDGTLIGKCTEELSAEPGFHDAKIKLTDSDGTCYSNKIQLHVERSPQ